MTIPNLELDRGGSAYISVGWLKLLTCRMACSSAKPMNGAAHATGFEEQNRAVMAKLYASLLPRGVGEENGLVREPATTALSVADTRTAEIAADKIAAVIRNTPSIAVERGVRDFKVAGWDVNADNVEDEFREVERRTFSDDVHWGRVIAFLAFSISFSAYVSSRGIKGGAHSVFGWTNRVLNKTLGDFMEEENGWVSYCCSCIIMNSLLLLL